MIQLIYPFLVSLADHVRGGWLSDHGIKIPSKINTALHSWTIALCLGHGFDVAGLWLVVALTLGEASGWGHPLGWALFGKDAGKKERYEFGPLLRNPWLSLAVRGLIWALPAAVVAFFYDPLIYNLLWIMSGTMVAAPWIATKTAKRFPDLWATQEFYRGFLTGALAVAVTYIGGQV